MFRLCMSNRWCRGWYVSPENGQGNNEIQIKEQEYKGFTMYSNPNRISFNHQVLHFTILKICNVQLVWTSNIIYCLKWYQMWSNIVYSETSDLCLSFEMGTKKNISPKLFPMCLHYAPLLNHFCTINLAILSAILKTDGVSWKVIEKF